MDEIIVLNNNIDKDKQKYKLKALWNSGKNIEVYLQILHDQKNLILDFDVFEEEIRRESKFNNDNVYEDSCLECFLKNENSAEYLNFEISATSFCLVGKGKDRFNRKLFDTKDIEEISREVNIISDEKNNCHWTLKIFIDLYKWNLINCDKEITGQKISANFYKCGDKLQKPHYLALFDIDSEIPNFHVSKSFRNLIFL